ncbi:MAG: OB-fold nucleic acid binding domain-containing protein, partial [Parcubacteria group bacterium]
MQENEQFKRHTAFKIRIGELLNARQIMNGDKFSCLEFGNKNIVRVNIVGNIVDKYESAGESRYINLTLDDGSGQIKLKTFGEDSDRFRSVAQGQTIIIIGILRLWNNELYITPELIKEQDSKYLLIRKLELEKEKSKIKDPLGRDEIVAVKDRILGSIKNAEEEGGIEKELLIMNLKDISPHIINQEVQ